MFGCFLLPLECGHYSVTSLTLGMSQACRNTVSVSEKYKLFVKITRNTASDKEVTQREGYCLELVSSEPREELKGSDMSSLTETLSNH